MKIILNWFFVNITARFPVALLVGALVLSGFSIWTALGLKYNPRMDNLLPQNLDLIKEFNEVVEITGGSGPLVVVLEGLNTPDAPKVIDELASQLEKVSGVRYVDSKLPKEYLNNRQLHIAPKRDLEKLNQLMREASDYARGQLGGFFALDSENFNPAELQELADQYHIFDEINPYYKGHSKKRYYIFVQPKGTATNTDFTEDFVLSIRETINRSGLEKQFDGLRINLTGSLIVRLEENQTIVQDLKRAALLAIVLATSIIILYTRSWFSLPLIIFPLLLSLTYTFALTQLWIGHVNIISGFLVAILMGLGIDYGIHLFIRFKQELLKGEPIQHAVEIVMTQVGRSGLVAMLTTIGVFCLLIFSGFRGFSEFGQIAVIGIVSAFITYYFIFPAQVLVYDKIHWLRKPRPRLFTLRISKLYSKTPLLLAMFFLTGLVGSLFLIPSIQFEYDFQKLRGDSPAADYETETTNDFGFAFSPTVILTPKKENLFEIHQALDDIKQKNGDRSTIGLIQSLNLFTKKEFESKKEVLNDIKEFFDEEKDIIRLSLGDYRYRKLYQLINKEPFDETKIPDSLIQRFTIEDKYLLLLFSPADKNFFDVRNIYILEEEIDQLKVALKEKNIETAILNENLIAAEILDWVKEQGPTAMALATLLVLLILIFDLKSLKLALVAFIPLVTGLAITGAIMATFHVKLNFINFIMLPSIIGIMIDHCIYLIHHILDYSNGETLRSLKETGSAIILSALTTLSGYASLNIANHAGIQSIATLVEIGIIVCTVCALFMLPTLYDLFISDSKWGKISARKKILGSTDKRK